MALLQELLDRAPEITALRRDIHAHPELCFEEIRTADLVARQLEGWGIAVHRGLGRTGVVGTIHGRDGGASGRAIGLRADMDALPMQEFNTFEHANRHAGKCMPADMTAMSPCCWLPRSTWPRTATASMARCT